MNVYSKILHFLHITIQIVGTTVSAVKDSQYLPEMKMYMLNQKNQISKESFTLTKSLK